MTDFFNISYLCFKVTSPDQMISDLEKELGITLQNSADDTTPVPKRLALPLDKLTAYLNRELNLHSAGVVWLQLIAILWEMTATISYIHLEISLSNR